MLLITLAVVQCPALPKDTVGSYYPPNCDDEKINYKSRCDLSCPAGYQVINGRTGLKIDSRTCLINGTWEYRAATPKCKGILYEIVLMTEEGRGLNFPLPLIPVPSLYLSASITLCLRVRNIARSCVNSLIFSRSPTLLFSPPILLPLPLVSRFPALRSRSTNVNHDGTF